MQKTIEQINRMKDFAFEEQDNVGEGTLDVISEADRFNRWMYKTIKPFCNNKVLEIGSGIGNISEFFLDEDFEILLTDIRQGYCTKLESRFSQNPGFLGAEVMDLTDPDFEIKFKDLLGQFNTVFALNVVEHIKDDMLALRNCKKLLKPGGHIIILVPSYQKLYNFFDKELGHYRRYTLSTLAEVFNKNNIEIIHRQYFNFIGIFGWYISGNLLKKETIPDKQMKLYNSLVPLFKIIDKVIFNKAGLSTIIVGKIL